ncbi:hypothetical protein SEA_SERENDIPITOUS_41 [Mycobacterium phage Serendipitous]|uniref:Uncharacterized protein n=1 Tax=Mycobacterium phage Serendipitous TaxID=2301619 RepID=A0A385UID0_9CAUD|nr:hypothetical protein I5G64_gp41 [Mycobacterium phage Serendipitous]AYB70583.1 hypothetical protein SEA_SERENDIPITOUS_41 [Mycobacterium phage Serendipitous]
MRLLFAGLLTLLAGVTSTQPQSWVVAVVGGMMIGCALYRDQMRLAALRARAEAVSPPPVPSVAAERITRERWRETRERRAS